MTMLTVPRGGMESKAPSWVHNKNPKNEMTAVAVTGSSSSSLNPTPDPNPTELRRELSCAMISEVINDMCCHTSPTSTMLDSGSTSHLIMDREYFMDFREEDHPPIKTANHGFLFTTG